LQVVVGVAATLGQRHDVIQRRGEHRWHSALRLAATYLTAVSIPLKDSPRNDGLCLSPKPLRSPTTGALPPDRSARSAVRRLSALRVVDPRGTASEAITSGEGTNLRTMVQLALRPCLGLPSA
jgi:hypothetical protein